MFVQEHREGKDILKSGIKFLPWKYLKSLDLLPHVKVVSLVIVCASVRFVHIVNVISGL
jgi:hypothetical protein